MRKTTKLIAVLMTLAMVVAMFAACGNSQAPAQNQAAEAPAEAL